MADLLNVSLEALRRKRASKWTAFGADVLPAWVADMDFPVAPPVHAAILDVLAREDLGYPATESLQALGTAFAARMSERFGWEPEPNRVMPVGSLIQAIIASVSTFSAPGKGVVIQTPIYPPFLKIVKTLGRRVVDNPLLAGPTRYEMDLDGLRRQLDGDTQMILFCNPHNPTGRVFERSELEELAALALEHDLVIVSDEIHADLVYAGGRHIPFASLGPEIAARTITITSATKAFNIAGLKCALLHFGSRELMTRQTAIFADHLLGIPNILGIEATLAAWRDGGEWLAAVLAQLHSNRAAVTAFLAQRLPGVQLYPPEAGYLAWLDCNALELPCRPYEFFLSEARVALNDGAEFSSRSADFVRLNFATSPDILNQILEQMTVRIESLSR